MKTFEKYKIVKEVEKALLIEAHISEIGKTMQFWLPKSKVEQEEGILSVDMMIWENKLEELSHPPAEEYVLIFVNEYEEMEKVYKIFLSASLKKISLNPWAFLPKSQVAEIEELEEDDERGKYCIRVKKWIWDKTLDGIIDSQLNFFNENRDDKDKFTKRNFTLHTIVEDE